MKSYVIEPSKRKGKTLKAIYSATVRTYKVLEYLRYTHNNQIKQAQIYKASQLKVLEMPACSVHSGRQGASLL